MLRTLEQKFAVNYSYPVIFARNVFAGEDKTLAAIISEKLPKARRVLVFVDSGVLDGLPELVQQIEHYTRAHADAIELVAPPQVIAGGERCKNDPATISRIHELIHRHHLCRQSIVLVVGGGAVLDAVGFGAATAHRGLLLIRMPTTVLAQNDAGVGVKNGVNAFGRKNYLGTFAPPFAVINDFAFLDSLPERDLRAGIVEAVKVALIKDEGFFRFLYRERLRLAAFVPELMEEMICRCAELHLNHIATQGDPFEFGSARPLDFGHWSAHKLEEITNGALNHGEAVAIGIALDTLYCRQCGMISQEELEMVLTVLEDLGLDLYHPALQAMSVDNALDEFRQHLGGDLTITLLTGLGVNTEVHVIDTDRMRQGIDLLAARTCRRPIVLRQTGSSPDTMVALRSAAISAAI